jgi:D-inositol-3-phosphate glycosyltransferase
MIEKRIGVIMYQTSQSKGQELVAQRMVRDFRKLGHEAYLITSTYHDGSEVVPPEGLIQNKGYYFVEDESLHIPVIRVDSNLAKWPPRRIVFKDFIHTLNHIVDDFGLNVLVSHSTLWNGPEDAAKFITWRRHIREVGGYKDPMVFCHMSHFQEPSSQRYSIPELTFRTAWNKMALSKVLEAANLVLVVTPFEKHAKIKMGANPDKCFLYPGGVDNETFMRYAAEDPAEFLKHHHITPGVRIVSYLGTLEERKNPAAILKIAERFKDRSDIQFVLAGKGDSDYGANIIKMAGDLPNVHYLGEINEREKILLIRASYLNILMSKLEALGISQLEFMYGGIPVITSGVGGQSWIVQNGVEGLHTKGPGDIEGAVNAIQRLVEDKNLYRTMSNNARERAAKYSCVYLTEKLDSAIDRDMVRDSQLTGIPTDLRDTLTKPEYALKSWSIGSSGVVATNRSVFIRRGLLSKSVLGLRYNSIKAIEHSQRYPWRIPAIGLIISCLALAIPLYKDVLAPNIISGVAYQWHNILDQIPLQINFEGWLFFLLASIPFVLSLIIFLLQSRSGFQLYAEGIDPVYLPVGFKKAIEFIRQVQDTDLQPIAREKSPGDIVDIIDPHSDTRFRS